MTDTSLIFNVLDWYDVDKLLEEKLNNSESENSDSETKKVVYDSEKKYVIKMFGRTENGESVYIKVNNFPPHFYILLPESWTNSDTLDIKCEYLINLLKNKRASLYYTLEKYEIVERKKFYGFHANKTFKFLRLVFSNKKSMIDTVKLFDNAICMFNSSSNRAGIKERFLKFDVYESNIDPYIRFIHIRDLQSCGWIKIDKEHLQENTEPSTCTHNYTVDWFNIKSANITGIAPFYICSFDIECTSGDGSFPQASRYSDKIIQIGMTFTNYGKQDIVKQIMISLDTCDKIKDTEVIECKTEKDLLLAFQKVIEREDPDIMTGYNIFNFDYSYLMDRAKYLGVPKQFYHLSKLKNHFKKDIIVKNLSSSALGDNRMSYIEMIGRVNIDLMKVVQRDIKLSSYKLDSVAENFFKDKVKKIEYLDKETKIYSHNIAILKVNNFIRFEIDEEVIMKKYKITNINYDEKWFTISNTDIDNFDTKNKIFWGMVKDDIKPNDIFELYKKTSSDRKMIAEYCIQDCALVSKLMAKLEIITNNISMANVCHVPLHYIFFRGQGIKSLSLVAKFCRKNNYLIPVMKKPDEPDDGYEGATVFEPKIGFHRKPVPVMDYNSLYPSEIIATNISHETYVSTPEYDNLPNYTYYNRTYVKHDGSQVHCRFAKLKDEFLEKEPAKSKFGIIPTILKFLIDERKATKKEMEKETDAFKKNILDGKQLALKITANSIYGQLGASTSPIYFKHGAACTTAGGRDRLCFAKEFVETSLTDILYNLYLTIDKPDEYENILKKHLKERDQKFETFLKDFVVKLFDKYTMQSDVIYGDTDSIFINMNLKDKNTKEDVYDKETLQYNIDLGKCASKFLKTLLPYPHNMEYEKTFYPFALMAKKKYIGNKFENDTEHYKQTSMGVVLKRRDNANIVKKIVGGMVNIMMNDIDIDKTIRFIKKSITDLLKGKIEIHEFITSKTLKANYVDRTRLNHVVLADRMTARDPGNAPQLNDRIPFVAIEVQQKKGEKILQGDKIEHPDYILQNKLKIDYLFYLTNQIMNPSIQFLELIMKPADANKLFQDFIDAENNKKIGRQSLLKSKFGISKNNIENTDNINDNIQDDDWDIGFKFINNNAGPNKSAKSKNNNASNTSNASN